MDVFLGSSLTQFVYYQSVFLDALLKKNIISLVVPGLTRGMQHL